MWPLISPYTTSRLIYVSASVGSRSAESLHPSSAGGLSDARRLRLRGWAERIRTSRWRFCHLAEMSDEFAWKCVMLWILSPAAQRRSLKSSSGGSNPVSPARLALAVARGNAGERAHHSLSTAKTLLKDCAGRIHGPETVARYFGAG